MEHSKSSLPCIAPERLGRALGRLRGEAEASGRNALPRTLGAGGIGRWLTDLASDHGFAVAPLPLYGAGLEGVLPVSKEGFALFASYLGGIDAELSLFVVRRRRPGPGLIELLDPDGTWHLQRIADLEESLGDPRTGGTGDVDTLIAGLELPRDERAQLAAFLARGGRNQAARGEGWILTPQLRTFWPRVRRMGAIPLLLGTLLATLLQLSCLLASWAVIGGTVLAGRADSGRLTGSLATWPLLLASQVVTQAAAGWLASRLSVAMGALVRERLLEGILHLPLDEVKQKGIGQLLGQVLEAEAIEALARGGGLIAVGALFQWVIAAGVLAVGDSGGRVMVSFALWSVLAVVVAGVLYRRLGHWARSRLALTLVLVEKILGRQTIVTQQAPALWDDGEPAAMDGYEQISRRVDALAAIFGSVIPFGWLIVGLAALAPAFLANQTGTNPPTASNLALTLGGLLLGFSALRRMADALPALAAAGLAWKQTRSLFRASESDGGPLPLAARDAESEARPSEVLLAARALTFRRARRSQPVVDDATFDIGAADRIWVRGRSGSGKSTLAALLGGLERPTSGIVRLGGLDQHSLEGHRWRQQALLVPQFHQNHLVAAPLLFNLLLGRRWPPLPEDLREAEAVCQSLGLGELLGKMPAGLQQMVGDSGWQLSHGEMSRIFVARALLAPADLRILDESFAALDPGAAEAVLGAALAQKGALVIIAHE